MDQQLLTSQKNQVFERVQQAGLDPTRFEWSKSSETGIVSSELRVKDAPYFFRFEWQATGLGHRRVSRLCPGPDTREVVLEPYDWESQLIHVRQWLTLLRREIEAPDLWELANQQVELFRRPWEVQDNSPFNAEEQDQIARTLRELAGAVQETTELSREQKDATTEVLQHLEQAAKREGRRDWFFMLGGVVLGWAANAGISPQMVSHFAGELVRGVQGLL